MLFKLLPLQLLHLLQLPLLLMAAAGQPEYAASATHRLAKRMDLEVCIGHFDVHKNTIIRTGESQAIGGKYLQGLELDTLEECERLCCETDACDVYIFERKSGGYCYLFECGPPENFHCKFTRHANYTSAVLTPQVRSSMELASTPRPQLPHIPSNNISQQEWELSNLKLKPEAQRDKPSIAIMPTAGSSQSVGVAQTALAAAAAAAPQSVPAPHCGRFQFSCHSGECIAVYNACDGIPQCEDGSDEGPECNAVAIKPSSNSNSNSNNNMEQYQPVPPIQQQLQTAQQQQQQQQQHVIVLGPPPPPPPPPPMVNNREDASAWANRKLITETQQQQQQQKPQEILNMDEQLNSHIFNHKGGLQLQQQQQQPSTNSQGQVQGQPPPPAPLAPQSPPQLQLPSYNTNNNAAPAGAALYGMSLPRSGIYLQQQQQQQQPMPQQQQPQQVVNWPQVVAPPAQIAVQQPQQQSHAYITAAAIPAPAAAAAAAAAPPPAPPAPPAQPAQPAPAAAQSPQQAMLPVLNAAPTHDKNQAADEDYDDYEEDKSTEPPKKKQHKHKKAKSKTAKDPIELALEQNKQQQQQQLPAPVGPVHEQYKLIHENLALEFRDHDGHSERPGGAVLSLTLGLLVTAALSILIGCRMRTVGRRARRMGGKTPYSQEADFLVNGMYL
ncbi:hypothetical protein AWZ03_004964 [Drosophila navojoa]|uniref:MANSC domain-containing protein n=1 Tax=Drosophila navojoa TaxID=7232 RepID=A0A484BLC6_DRONA|nr:hypothetical protein AWZ03_004964 [Drosophila navojoa]